MNNRISNLMYFMLVLIPYLILVGYSVYVYPDLPDELSHGLPRVMIFIPAAIAVILPASYGAMVFFFSRHLRKAHHILIAVAMDIGILGLTGAVYLISAS
ncbi:MAG: hypothetical protein SVM79_07455 [Chloroflexota bacterium]|nr:hypothetical protein [Chloroflexota bacterium]